MVDRFTHWSMKRSSRRTTPSRRNGGYPREIYVDGVYSGVGMAVVHRLGEAEQRFSMSIRSILTHYRRTR